LSYVYSTKAKKPHNEEILKGGKIMVTLFIALLLAAVRVMLKVFVFCGLWWVLIFLSPLFAIDMLVGLGLFDSGVGEVIGNVVICLGLIPAALTTIQNLVRKVNPEFSIWRFIARKQNRGTENYSV